MGSRLLSGIEWTSILLLCLFVLTFAVELDGFDVKTVGKKIYKEDTTQREYDSHKEQKNNSKQD